MPSQIAQSKSDSLMLWHNRNAECQKVSANVVGIGSCRAMTDAEREQFIANCTYLMERAYADYEAHGNFADRGTADRWRILRDEAVKGRSATAVKRMELERGLV